MPTGWIIFFDTDDYVYVLDSADQAASWLEPATVEELDSAYDSCGHRLEIAPEGTTYRLRRAEKSQSAPSLGDRIRQAHTHGKLLKIDLSAEAEAIASHLRVEFRIVTKPGASHG
jgi:hypothetical protein